ncbi:MAG: hypothetical protein JWN04_5750 [Myxococcaceae bacterium]|nr:hypothetical protein [Myxococcaceae bacterium]
MSLFPRQLIRGQTVTIHARFSSPPPVFPEMHTEIRDRTGKLVFDDVRQLTGAPPQNAVCPATSAPSTSGLTEAPPILMLAHHLRSDAAAREELVQALVDMQHSTHWYRQWTAPDDAPLGHYQVELYAWIEGRRHTSNNPDTDRFAVESLTLADTGSRAGVARIHNPGPEPVEARLDEYGGPGEPLRSRRISLPAEHVTELCSEAQTALLIYAGGNAQLWLHGDDDPVYVRHPSCAWMHSHDSSLVLTSARTQRTFTLRERARELWLQAELPTRRSTLESISSAAFASLQTAGLLQRL